MATLISGETPFQRHQQEGEGHELPGRPRRAQNPTAWTQAPVPAPGLAGLPSRPWAGLCDTGLKDSPLRRGRCLLWFTSRCCSGPGSYREKNARPIPMEGSRESPGPSKPWRSSKTREG